MQNAAFMCDLDVKVWLLWLLYHNGAENFPSIIAAFSFRASLHESQQNYEFEKSNNEPDNYKFDKFIWTVLKARDIVYWNVQA